MSLSYEIKEKINQFAKEQSPKFLEEAEMTYLEKLRRKSGQTRDKINTKMAKFKVRSEQNLEAQDDMILYMNDYMNDLVSQGMTEEKAFEKASTELTFASKSSQAVSMQERYKQYYETQDLAIMEAVGLYYGAGSIIGLILGVIIGLIIGKGLFSEIPLWIPVVSGAAAGAVLGVGFGMLKHAKLIQKY